MASIRSVNIGSSEPNRARRGHPPTGFHKRPVTEAVVRAPGPRIGGLGSGLVGDVIGEAKYHGGDLQAVYAVAREELDAWGAELGADLPDGAFAENLTTAGLDVDAGRVGDRWAIRRRGRPRGHRPADPVRHLREPDGGARVDPPVHRGRPFRRVPAGRLGRHRAAR